MFRSKRPQQSHLIIRNHYQIPTIEDVLPKLNRAKCFSLFKAWFLQVKLTENLTKLTTFWTPLGRYCWNRLPFGLSSSPEEHQRRLHTVLDGLEGTEVIADDTCHFDVTCQNQAFVTEMRC